MDIHNFIAERKHLVWYVKNPRTLDDDAIVEAVLNYGKWADVQEMIQILGMQAVARIFRTHTNTTRCNYHVKTKNYFTLYFNKYA